MFVSKPPARATLAYKYDFWGTKHARVEKDKVEKRHGQFQLTYL